MGKLPNTSWRENIDLEVTSTGALMIIAVVIGVFAPKEIGKKFLLDVNLFLSSLSAGTITTIITSLITVAGFWVAFNISHSTWRAQMRAQLQEAAGNDLAAVLQEIDLNLMTVIWYASDCQSTSAKLHFLGGAITDDVKSDVAELMDDNSEITRARDALSEAWKKLHTSVVRHASALESTDMGRTAFESLIRGYWQIWRHSKFDLVPDSGTIQDAANFLTTHDLRKMQKFHKKASAVNEIAWRMVNDLKTLSARQIIGRPSRRIEKERKLLDREISEILQ